MSDQLVALIAEAIHAHQCACPDGIDPTHLEAGEHVAAALRAHPDVVLAGMGLEEWEARIIGAARVNWLGGKDARVFLLRGEASS